MTRSRLLPYLMVPVGLLLGLWAGWQWLRPAPSPDLFAQYFVPHQITDLNMGPLPNWSEAVSAYLQGDYVAANTALRKAEQAREVPAVITRFYQGQCLLATGYADEAAAVYLKLLQQPAGPHGPMRWYLALAYLQQDKRAQAREMLQQVQATSPYYAGTAAQILQELSSGAQ